MYKLLHVIGQIFILMKSQRNSTCNVKVLDPDLSESVGTQFFGNHDLREDCNAQITFCRLEKSLQRGAFPGGFYFLAVAGQKSAEKFKRIAVSGSKKYGFIYKFFQRDGIHGSHSVPG